MFWVVPVTGCNASFHLGDSFDRETSKSTNKNDFQSCMSVTRDLLDKKPCLTKVDPLGGATRAQFSNRRQPYALPETIHNQTFEGKRLRAFTDSGRFHGQFTIHLPITFSPCNCATLSSIEVKRY